jgi:hypothetical protein
MPEKLLSSFVRPAFHGLKAEGKRDRGTATRPVDSELGAAALPPVKKPGSPALQAKSSRPDAPRVAVIPQGPEPTAPPRRPARKLASTRLPSRSAAALRQNPDHVHEPHLHKRRSGNYLGLFVVLVIGFGFIAYTFGYLPLDQLFDQGNAAVQSHNDQVVAWILHIAPVLGVALLAVIAIVVLRSLFFSSSD